MVPTPLIILPFLFAFMLLSWQYYRVDPESRLLNVRAILMMISIVGAFGYPIYTYFHPHARLASWGLFGLAVICLVTTFYLLRRIPPKETD